jgi:hypothetical protein
MRRNDKKIVDFGTQAGIQVAVGDLVSILAASVTLDKEFWGISFFGELPRRDVYLHPKLGASPTI